MQTKHRITHYFISPCQTCENMFMKKSFYCINL
uniref:Uncharacterized protein n=1 Tax=Anguilla anguilla TaxID=7936 RepID=A0A0E9XE85_ANGAN